MDGFNRARVEVKHRGALHAQHVVAQHRAMVTEFLERTSPQLFGVKFDEISLSGLVRSRDVRACLQDAEKALTRQDLEAAVLNSARAFRRALRDFRFGDPPKSWERRLVDPTSLDNLRMGELRFPGAALDSHFVRRIGEAFERINEAMTVVAYNLDYDGYRHLLTFGPVLHEVPGHEPAVDWMFGIMPDQNAAERCIAFAIDAALRLEEMLADRQALCDGQGCWVKCDISPLMVIQWRGERPSPSCWTNVADYIRPVPTINLTADELAAVTAAIRRVIEDDRFPHASRASIRCARPWESSRRPWSQTRLPKAPRPAKVDKRARR